MCQFILLPFTFLSLRLLGLAAQKSMHSGDGGRDGGGGGRRLLLQLLLELKALHSSLLHQRRHWKKRWLYRETKLPRASS